MIYKFMSVAARATLAGDRGSELRRHFSVIELQHYYCPSIWLQVSSHHLTIERMLYWTSIFSSRAIWVRISSGKNYVEPIYSSGSFVRAKICLSWIGRRVQWHIYCARFRLVSTLTNSVENSWLKSLISLSHKKIVNTIWIYKVKSVTT